jgi:deoxyribonuclease-4
LTFAYFHSVFGSHLSIAGSMANAVREARALKLDCVQVFTKNQQQWKAPPLKDDAVREWKDELKASGWDDGRAGRTVAHASYLINLASPNPELWAKSVDSMVIELERCEALGIGVLVHHPGSSTGDPAEIGLENIVKAYREIFQRTKGLKVVSCLENTVGGGSTLGAGFDQLALLRARIADTTGEPDRLGFCFDTCHAHAAGHDMSTPENAAGVIARFEAICGLDHLRAMHLNDSRDAAGSKRDRHTHIGEGTLGLAAFGPVVNHPQLARIPKILETPKGTTEAGTPHDTLNLRKLKRLMGR